MEGKKKTSLDKQEKKYPSPFFKEEEGIKISCM